MRDYKKFFTLPDTAEFMAKLLDPRAGDVILEPSAGNGALVRAVKHRCSKTIVFAIELDEQWKPELKRAGANVVVIKDFLTVEPYARFTSAIANPPFGNGVDLQAHFDAIRRHVKNGGRIVMNVPDDFEPRIEYDFYPLANWGTNKDGSVTPIKIISFLN